MTDIVTLNSGELGPIITFRPSQNMLELSGNSIISHPDQLNVPVNDFLAQYISSGQKKLKVRFALNYFNTPTTRCLFEIIKKVQDLSKNDWEITIDWCYSEDDDDILDVGKIFKEIVEIPINIIQLQ